MKHLLLLVLLFSFTVTAQAPLKVSVTITLSGTPTEQQAAFEQYAKKYNWQPKVINARGAEVDNPESAEEFTVRHLEQHFSEVVSSDDAEKAADTARKAVKDSPRIEPDKKPKPKPENGGRIR